ncbi:hypothetical protein MED193_06249 [Roseobacter sp. MED193]|uniref:hypothetical protein n=1 Tax=Roseobacter sp. MED193 TaxID=314262 RepID=UPI000068ED8E|nr:hypothetical protein [Roseobacter sp. MED193]EAQ45971.1 hypothetical protein MED193_06249 [Roseobacter sp. MED193]
MTQRFVQTCWVTCGGVPQNMSGVAAQVSRAKAGQRSFADPVRVGRVTELPKRPVA